MYRIEVLSGSMHGLCSRAVWPYMWIWGNRPKNRCFCRKRVRHYIIQCVIGGGNPRLIDHRQERLLPKFVHPTPDKNVLESGELFSLPFFSGRNGYVSSTIHWKFQKDRMQQTIQHNVPRRPCIPSGVTKRGYVPYPVERWRRRCHALVGMVVLSCSLFLSTAVVAITTVKIFKQWKPKIGL